ncbi:MAG: HU family DNA-binding protein [Proteobacteria bacterium]|nr:HU family DNA-binding protein [Pseudomonadota bacterium]
MATAKKTTKLAPATKTAKAKTPAAAVVRPIKDTFTKGALTNHLAELSGVEPKAVKAVLAALETTVLGAVNKKGAGEFTLPGLLKIGVQKVPAKPKRKGINPFTKEEQVFAAKPATVRIKARALKKLKDAAL